MLMTDNLQPTVLRLMPFGSNDASSQHDFLYHDEGITYSRGFPRLAVTRVQNIQPCGQSKVHPIARSSSECGTRPKEYRYRSRSVPGSRANSEYNARTKKTPKTDGGCSVTDFNDQIMVSPNKNIDRDKYLSKHWLTSSNNELINSVTFLPKPHITRSLDGRYFISKNGFWRAVTLTPGEVDLRKKNSHKDISKYQKLQKKHKVNINSLPRSTTPINDYDPDKLNMKSVIAFLQKNSETETSPSDRVMDNKTKEETQKVKIKDNSDRNSSCSGKLTEPVPTMEQKFKHRGENNKHGIKTKPSNRSVRQFRLHRFLTMASKDKVDQFSETVNPTTQQVHFSDQNSNSSSSDKAEDKSSNYVQGDNGAIVSSPFLQKEAEIKCNVFLPVKQIIHSKSLGNKTHNKDICNSCTTDDVIRLPNMLEDEPQSDEDIDHLPEKSWSFINHNVFSTSAQTDGNSSSLSGITKPLKKLRINVPNSPDRSHDKIKLSLRQERTLTRENTYMSDLCDSRTDHTEFKTFNVDKKKR